VDSKRAEYVGSTHPPYVGAKDPIDLDIDTAHPEILKFTARKKPYERMDLAIPYTAILDLEYGQKVGRRVGAAIGTSLLLGPLGLVTLFAKKGKHYLTIGYKNEAGADQVAVIEIGKDAIRTTLAIVQTRSGKPIEYQDEETRKNGVQ
jgi:hypothetical protein